MRASIACLLLGASFTLHAQTIPVEPMDQNRISPEAARETKMVAQVPTSNVAEVYNEQFAERKPLISNNFLEKVASTWRPKQEFNVKPKDNIMIAVGQGLMNTISTNLTMLTAKTNDESSTFEIDQGYLYVTVGSTQPISLVLYEEGVLESQISVTLVPVAAPPTIARINFDLTADMKAQSDKFQKAIKLEEDQASHQPAEQAKHDSHTARLIDILRPVAQGDVPQGFGLSSEIPDAVRHPCQMTIEHRTEQRMIGGSDIIDVVLVHNDSDKIYNLREEMCLTKGTLAVALFDKAYLQPGERSEIYIVRDKRVVLDEQRRQRRPRLIGGN